MKHSLCQRVHLWVVQFECTHDIVGPCGQQYRQTKLTSDDSANGDDQNDTGDVTERVENRRLLLNTFRLPLTKAKTPSPIWVFTSRTDARILESAGAKGEPTIQDFCNSVRPL